MCCSTSLYTLICRYAPSWSADAALTPLEFTPTKIITTRATEMASKNIFELLGIGRNLLQSVGSQRTQLRLDAVAHTPDHRLPKQPGRGQGLPESYSRICRK